MEGLLDGIRLRSRSGVALAACGVWMVGLGAYFIFVRPALLPEDPRYIGSSLGEIQAALPGLARWLGRVFTVMGGFMAGAGLLTAFVALVVVPRRLPGTGVCLLLSGLATVGTMSAVNFALDSDFKWLLLAPALLWAAGLALYFGEGQGSRRLDPPTGGSLKVPASHSSSEKG